MPNNAKISLLGNLTKDPVMRQTKNGNVCSIRIAVTTSKKNPDNTFAANYYDVSVWGNPGEYIMQRMQKGTMVWITGDFHQGEYTGQDGKVVQTLNIENADVRGIMRLKEVTGQPANTQSSADNEIPF